MGGSSPTSLHLSRTPIGVGPRAALVILTQDVKVCECEESPLAQKIHCLLPTPDQLTDSRKEMVLPSRKAEELCCVRSPVVFLDALPQWVLTLLARGVLTTGQHSANAASSCI